LLLKERAAAAIVQSERMRALRSKRASILQKAGAGTNAARSGQHVFVKPLNEC
jgi:hypothetical protein